VYLQFHDVLLAQFNSRKKMTELARGLHLSRAVQYKPFDKPHWFQPMSDLVTAAVGRVTPII